MNIRLHNLSKAQDIAISGLFVNHGNVFPSYLRLPISKQTLLPLYLTNKLHEHI